MTELAPTQAQRDAVAAVAMPAYVVDDFAVVYAQHYRRLARPVLPDPAANRVEFIAAAFALPAWLVARWLERFGWEECLRLGFWFAGPAPVWLRCNTLRTDRDTCLAAFHLSRNKKNIHVQLRLQEILYALFE